MSEISEEEFEKLEKCREVNVYELSEKEWNRLDEEKMLRMREKKRRIWESKKKLDEMRRDSFDGRVLDILKKKYERESIEWFERVLKSEVKERFKKYKLIKRDNYCWRVEIVGIKENGEEKVIMVKSGGLVDLDKYRRRFNF